MKKYNISFLSYLYGYVYTYGKKSNSIELHNFKTNAHINISNLKNIDIETVYFHSNNFIIIENIDEFYIYDYINQKIINRPYYNVEINKLSLNTTYTIENLDDIKNIDEKFFFSNLDNDDFDNNHEIKTKFLDEKDKQVYLLEKIYNLDNIDPNYFIVNDRYDHNDIVIDKTGKVVLSNYKHVIYFNNNVGIVLEKNKYFLINYENKVLASSDDFIQIYRDIFIINKYTKKSNTSYIINKEGEVLYSVKNYKIRKILSFDNYYYLFNRENDKIIILDNNFKKIYTYHYPTYSTNDINIYFNSKIKYFIFYFNNYTNYYSLTKKRKIFQTPVENLYIINPKLYFIIKNKKYNVYHLLKNKKIGSYDLVLREHNDHIIVKNKNYYGIINDDGKLICDFQYNNITELKNNYFFAEKNNKYYIINKNGVEIDLI